MKHSKVQLDEIKLQCTFRNIEELVAAVSRAAGCKALPLRAQANPTRHILTLHAISPANTMNFALFLQVTAHLGALGY